MATVETHDLLQHFKGSRNSRFLAKEEDGSLYAGIEKGGRVQRVKRIVQLHKSVWCDVSTGARERGEGKRKESQTAVLMRNIWLACLLPPSSPFFVSLPPPLPIPPSLPHLRMAALM